MNRVMHIIEKGVRNQWFSSKCYSNLVLIFREDFFNWILNRCWHKKEILRTKIEFICLFFPSRNFFKYFFVGNFREKWMSFIRLLFGFFSFSENDFLSLCLLFDLTSKLDDSKKTFLQFLSVFASEIWLILEIIENRIRNWMKQKKVRFKFTIFFGRAFFNWRRWSKIWR